MPLTPKAATRYIRWNATRKGIFGGSKMWLGVWGFLKLKGFAGKVTKKGEPELAFSQTVKPGHWFEIVHEKPPASRREKRKAKKAAAKAEAKRLKAQASPTRRNINRALRAAKSANKVNKAIGPGRNVAMALTVADSVLTKRQLKRRNEIDVSPRDPLEVLDAAKRSKTKKSRKL